MAAFSTKCCGPELIGAPHSMIPGSGDDVTTDDGWQAALGAYNRSVSYAHDVADLATSYADPAA